MKLKEWIWGIEWLRPSVRFYPIAKEVIGDVFGEPVEFFQWRTPKSRDVKLDADEPSELRQFITPGDVAIDVGAQIGDSTLPIALACGPEGCVFAFEPNPICFSVLAKNAVLNPKLTRIIPIPFACTDTESSLVFNYSDPWLANGGDKRSFGVAHGHQFPVPVDGLHPLNFLTTRYVEELERLKYLKIDVEGLDLMVLRQFEPLIDAVKPFIKFEIAKFTGASEREALIKFFSDKPYTLRRVDADRNRLFGPVIDVSEFHAKGSFDVFCVPDSSGIATSC